MALAKEKIRINGLRISAKLAFLNAGWEGGGNPGPDGFLKSLAQKRINLPFLNIIPQGASQNGFFCTALGDFHPASLALGDSCKTESCLEQKPVGTIMVYPHKSSLALAGAVLKALAQAGIFIHATGSSISAITVIVDYAKLEEAISCLLAVLDLAEGHAPFYQELDMERFRFQPPKNAPLVTEDDNSFLRNNKIPVYTISQKTGLYLIILTFLQERLALLGGLLEEVGRQGTSFDLAMGRAMPEGRQSLLLLMESASAQKLAAKIAALIDSGPGSTMEMMREAEALFLFGPHFEDRYGIADAAISLLAQKPGILVGACCTGTTIGLVVPQNRACEAAKMLEVNFMVPKAQPRKKTDDRA